MTEAKARITDIGLPDESPGEVMAAEKDGIIVLDDGTTTWNPRRATEFLTAQLEAEVLRLRTLLNSPQTADWVEGVRIEAAHQQERWGTAHDAGKEPEDWFWLLGYLAGKAVAAFRAGNTEKGVHHIVSSGAVLLNWHRHVQYIKEG